MYEDFFCISGLDESVSQYVTLFKVHEVDGRKLLMLNHADLEKIGVKKLGHQELVLEAIDLLRTLVIQFDIFSICEWFIFFAAVCLCPSLCVCLSVTKIPAN